MSESDVKIRQVMTSKVGPRAERVEPVYINIPFSELTVSKWPFAAGYTLCDVR